MWISYCRHENPARIFQINYPQDSCTCKGWLIIYVKVEHEDYRTAILEVACQIPWNPDIEVIRQLVTFYASSSMMSKTIKLKTPNVFRCKLSVLSRNQQEILFLLTFYCHLMQILRYSVSKATETATCVARILIHDMHKVPQWELSLIHNQTKGKSNDGIESLKK